ncbi:hypothetical protein D3C84_915970 [compost metagenome]
MKKLLAALALTLTTPAAFAACFGTGSLQTCNDSSGNTYNVQRFGNTTNMQGYNAGTGSNWNQTSQRIGNTTIHNGTSADGNSWQGTSQQIGNSTIYNGVDSNGNVYSRTCNQFGCF